MKNPSRSASAMLLAAGLALVAAPSAAQLTWDLGCTRREGVRD